MNTIKPKTYADCVLYQKYPQYNAILLDAIMRGERIDKAEKAFEDVVYEIKRSRTDATLLKVLTSKNTVLLDCGKSLPKPFKVFCAKDAKTDKQVKAFIDITNVVIKDPDGYTVKDESLISYLCNAKLSMYYTLRPEMIIHNNEMMTLAATCFAQLYTHIVDYVGKISAIEYAKDKCNYLAARYFLINVACMDDEDRVRSIARKVSGITEMKENTYDFMVMKNAKKGEDPFRCPIGFTKLVAQEFKIEKLTLDIILEKWMYLYGQGTGFAIEYYPAFSAMMTDAYCGAYINNQKTIEKICGTNVVQYAKKIIYNFG